SNSPGRYLDASVTASPSDLITWTVRLSRRACVWLSTLCLGLVIGNQFDTVSTVAYGTNDGMITTATHSRIPGSSRRWRRSWFLVGQPISISRKKTVRLESVSGVW